jgi:hypothetical protein
MNKEYRVTVKFDQVQIGHIPVYAQSEDDAREQALKLMDRHKNPEIINITDFSSVEKAPSVETTENAV